MTRKKGKGWREGAKDTFGDHTSLCDGIVQVAMLQSINQFNGNFAGKRWNPFLPSPSATKVDSRRVNKLEEVHGFLLSFNLAPPSPLEHCRKRICETYIILKRSQ